MNSKNKKEPTIKDFIGTAKFDENGGGYIWGVDKQDGHQMIAEVRGWGAIQNLFPDDQTKAELFQDELGKFIADAINEKLKKL